MGSAERRERLHIEVIAAVLTAGALLYAARGLRRAPLSLSAATVALQTESPLAPPAQAPSRIRHAFSPELVVPLLIGATPALFFLILLGFLVDGEVRAELLWSGSFNALWFGLIPVFSPVLLAAGTAFALGFAGFRARAVNLGALTVGLPALTLVPRSFAAIQLATSVAILLARRATPVRSWAFLALVCAAVGIALTVIIVLATPDHRITRVTSWPGTIGRGIVGGALHGVPHETVTYIEGVDIEGHPNRRTSSVLVLKVDDLSMTVIDNNWPATIEIIPDNRIQSREACRINEESVLAWFGLVRSSTPSCRGD